MPSIYLLTPRIHKLKTSCDCHFSRPFPYEDEEAVKKKKRRWWWGGGVVEVVEVAVVEVVVVLNF